jgi:hypothetical protein
MQRCAHRNVPSQVGSTFQGDTHLSVIAQSVFRGSNVGKDAMGNRGEGQRDDMPYNKLFLGVSSTGRMWELQLLTGRSGDTGSRNGGNNARNK